MPPELKVDIESVGNMSEAIEKKLVEIYESLTDEQKEKAEACNSLEELFEFVDKEGIDLPQEMRDHLLEAANENASKLSLDDLESVTGGATRDIRRIRTFVIGSRVIAGRGLDQNEINRVSAEGQEGQ